MTFLEKIFSSLSHDVESTFLSEVGTKTIRSISKHEFGEMVSKARSTLQHRNIQKGDRVILISGNSVEWIAADLAILSMGAVCVPLYYRQGASELAQMCDDSKPSLLIYSDPELLEKMKQCGPFTIPTISLREMFLSSLSGPPSHLPSSEEIATIIYTSGSSGSPKGAMITHGNLNFMLEATTAQLGRAINHYIGEKKQPSVFHFLPLCFAGSRIMLWTQLLRDTPVSLSTDLKNLAEEIKLAAPDFFLTVPAVLERIRSAVESDFRAKGFLWAYAYRHLGFLLAPLIRRKIFTRTKFMICGSAALSIDTQVWFTKLGLPILQVYGLTETTAIISMDEAGDEREGFVGNPISGVELKVASNGELLVRGPNIFSGYWNRPVDSKESFEDSWFKTGDLAQVSTSGHLQITGRVKNVIVPASGHNIVPEPIEESVQKQCPNIEHAVLIGHGKPYLSLIVTGNVSEKEVNAAIDRFNRDVPHYRKIRNFIRHEAGFTVENGLLTANQKLKRHAIENLLMPKIEEVYARNP